jgi:hypothetical protein
MAKAIRQYIPQSKVNYHTGFFQMLRFARIRYAFTKSKGFSPSGFLPFQSPDNSYAASGRQKCMKNSAVLSPAENPERIPVIAPQN